MQWCRALLVAAALALSGCAAGPPQPSDFGRAGVFMGAHLAADLADQPEATRRKLNDPRAFDHVVHPQYVPQVSGPGY